MKRLVTSNLISLCPLEQCVLWDMSGSNTPGSKSGTPDPREAREPPDFASQPQETYDFVCSVLEESISEVLKHKRALNNIMIQMYGNAVKTLSIFLSKT